MNITESTRTIYVLEDGREFTSREDAEVAARIDAVTDFLWEHGGLSYDFDVANVAAAILKDKAAFIALIGGAE